MLVVVKAYRGAGIGAPPRVFVCQKRSKAVRAVPLCVSPESWEAGPLSTHVEVSGWRDRRGGGLRRS